jgi:hypothetical protein
MWIVIFANDDGSEWVEWQQEWEYWFEEYEDGGHGSRERCHSHHLYRHGYDHADYCSRGGHSRNGCDSERCHHTATHHVETHHFEIHHIVTRHIEPSRERPVSRRPARRSQAARRQLSQRQTSPYGTRHRVMPLRATGIAQPPVPIRTLRGPVPKSRQRWPQTARPRSLGFATALVDN